MGVTSGPRQRRFGRFGRFAVAVALAVLIGGRFLIFAGVGALIGFALGDHPALGALIGFLAGWAAQEVGVRYARRRWPTRTGVGDSAPAEQP